MLSGFKAGERYNYHDGNGWRGVEFVARLGGLFVRVRDVFSGRYLDVRDYELKPIVPRSEWERR